jgi:phage shock protein A
MGIMTRIMRLCKADLHGVMDQLEDKELLLKQYLREMEESLQEKEKRMNQIMSSEAGIQGDLTARAEEIDKIEKDLDLSLRKEKDDIAKLLIRKQRNHKSACDQLRQQLRTLEEERQHLGRLLGEQRMQYDQLKVKTAAFCSQAEQRAFEEAHALTGGSGILQTADEEEIELELLRRKEVLQSGGDA